MNYATLAILVAFVILPSSCVAQLDESTIDGLKWYAVVSDSTAEFTFPLAGRKKWTWHNADTPNNRLEYGWNVDVIDNGTGYQFGASLFHHSDAPARKGTLANLLETCQHDLWRVAKDSGDNIGKFGKIDIVDSRVRISISNQKLIEKIFDKKPTHVDMSVNMPGCTVRKRVFVEYKK